MTSDKKPEETPVVAAAAAAPTATATSGEPEFVSVFVTNIAGGTSDKAIGDFFSYCGQIKSLIARDSTMVANTREAIVTFDTAAAAKTAALLSNSLIADRAIEVRPFDTAKDSLPTDTPVPSAGIPQKQYGAPDASRTKTSVIASMIAAGYVLGEDIKRKAIEYDQKWGLTTTISQKAAAIDHSLGLTPKYVATTEFLTEQSQLAYARAASATSYVGERLNKVDVPAKLTTAANTVGTKITDTADKIAVAVSESPFVNSAIAAMRTAGASISGAYESLRTESTAAIEQRHLDRPLGTEMKPVSAPAVAATAPAEAVAAVAPEAPPVPADKPAEQK